MTIQQFIGTIFLVVLSIVHCTASSNCRRHDEAVLCESSQFSRYNLSSLNPDLYQSSSQLHIITGVYIDVLPTEIMELIIEQYPLPSFQLPFSSPSLQKLFVEHGSLAQFPPWLCQHNTNLTTIEISFSNIEQIVDHDLHLCHHLETLRITHSRLRRFSTPTLANLSIQYLYLSYNQFQSISEGSTSGLQLNRLEQLRTLDLSNNQIQSICSQTFYSTPSLSELDLSSNQLNKFHINHTKYLGSIKVLNLMGNAQLQMNTNWYPYFPHLKKIYFPYAHFCCHSKIDLQKTNRKRTEPIVSDPIPKEFTDTEDEHSQKIQHVNLVFASPQICYPLPDDMTPCESLFSSTWIRSIFLIIVLISVGANLAALILNIVRLIVSAYNRWSISTILSSNLALADFISSIYLVFIGILDLRFQKDFHHQTQYWTSTPLCTSAGFIYIFGIQSSIYALTLLTFERFYTILFSFKRQTPWPTKITLLSISFGWLISLLIASLPLININDFHANSLCVPFRIETLFDRMYLSFLIIFDLCSLGIIITCNSLICFNFSKSHVHTSNDARATVKILTLVVAICISRIPLIIFIFLALVMRRNYKPNSSLNFHDIKLAILFLQPISSIFNPFMYSSLSTLNWTTPSGFERPKPARKSRKLSRSHSRARSQSERGYFPLRMMSTSSLDYRCSSLPNTP